MRMYQVYTSRRPEHLEIEDWQRNGGVPFCEDCELEERLKELRDFPEAMAEKPEDYATIRRIKREIKEEASGGPLLVEAECIWQAKKTLNEVQRAIDEGEEIKITLGTGPGSETTLSIPLEDVGAKPLREWIFCRRNESGCR